MSQSQNISSGGGMPSNDGTSGRLPDKNKPPRSQPSTIPTIPPKLKQECKKPVIPPRPSLGLSNRWTPDIFFGGNSSNNLLRQDICRPRLTKKDLDGPLSPADRHYVDSIVTVPPVPIVPNRYVDGRLRKDRGDKDVAISLAYKIEDEPQAQTKPQPAVAVVDSFRPKSNRKIREVYYPPRTVEFECEDNEDELEEQVNKHFGLNEMLEEQRRRLISEGRKGNAMTNSRDEKFGSVVSKFFNPDQVKPKKGEQMSSQSSTSKKAKSNVVVVTPLEKELTFKSPPLYLRRSAHTMKPTIFKHSEPPVLPTLSTGDKLKATFDRLSKPKGIVAPNSMLRDMVTKATQGNSRNQDKPIGFVPKNTYYDQTYKTIKKHSINIQQLAEELTYKMTSGTPRMMGNDTYQIPPSNTNKKSIGSPYLKNQHKTPDSKSKGKSFSGLTLRRESKSVLATQIANRGKFFCGPYLQQSGLLGTKKTTRAAPLKGKGKTIRKVIPKGVQPNPKVTNVALPMNMIPSQQQSNFYRPDKSSVNNKMITVLKPSSPIFFEKVSTSTGMNKFEIIKKPTIQIPTEEKIYPIEPRKSELIDETYFPPNYCPYDPRGGIFEPVLPRIRGTYPSRTDMTSMFLAELDPTIGCERPIKHHRGNTMTIMEFMRAGAEFETRSVPIISAPHLISTVKLIKGSLSSTACEQCFDSKVERYKLYRPKTSISLDSVSMAVCTPTIPGSDVSENDLDNFSCPSRGESLCGDGNRSFDEDFYPDKFRDYYDQRDGFNEQLHIQEHFQNAFHPRDKFSRFFWRSESNTSFPDSELSLARSNPSATVSTLSLSDIQEEDEDLENTSPGDMDDSLLKTLQDTCADINNAKPMSKELTTALQNVENENFDTEEWKNLQVCARNILQENFSGNTHPEELHDLWDPSSESSVTSYGTSSNGTKESESEDIKLNSNDQKTATTPNLREFARILKIVKLSERMSESNTTSIWDKHVPEPEVENSEVEDREMAFFKRGPSRDPPNQF